MPSILVQFDEQTLKTLDQIAPLAKRKRADFIRQAVREAIWKRQNGQTRAAYLKQLDSAEEADDWANAEEWKP